eukprot:4637278-Amphidinium_carterae.1
MTSEKLTVLVSEGCSVFCGTQKEMETIYVPAGWIVAEQSMRGVLIYGMRVSAIVPSQQSSLNYEALLDMNRASGKAVEQMKGGLDLISPLQNTV